MSDIRAFRLRRGGGAAVAEGTQFSDGTVALHWPGSTRAGAATSVRQSIDAMLAVHGHDGPRSRSGTTRS